MSFLKKNLDIIKIRFPRLFELLASYEKTSEYTVEISREGSPTVQINGHYIHSKFNPLREADRFIKSEISTEARFVIFAGYGLGYHIENFLEDNKETAVLVVEPDISFFLFSLSVRNMQTILESQNVQFLIGGKPDNCTIILEEHPGKLVQLVTLRSVYSLHEGFYRELDTFIRNYISRKEINLSTLRRFGRLWVRNLAANTKQLTLAPGINSIQGIFSDFPALLIAAGPSLDNIKPYLKELHKRFLIITVDTALRVCLEEGVEPDFTIVVDPQYWNSRHLDRCLTNKTILISETSTYPTVFRQIQGKVFLCSSSFPLGLYIEEQTELKGKLKAGGSVATAAWDFCRVLSIKNIWCAGLDLGFPRKQTHCKGSYFEQRAHWLSERTAPSETFSWHALHDAGLTAVKSNSGNLTWTDKRMSLYSHWFEEQMHQYKDIQNWNLSDEGIKINGMPQRSLNEAIKLPPVRNQIDKIINRIKKIETDSNLKIRLQVTLKQLISELSYLKDLTNEGMSLCTTLENNFKNKLDINIQLEQLSTLDEKILKAVSKDIAGFLLQNFISDLQKEDKEKNGLDIIKKSYNLYKELSESTEFNIIQIKKTQKDSENT